MPDRAMRPARVPALIAILLAWGSVGHAADILDLRGTTAPDDVALERTLRPLTRLPDLVEEPTPRLDTQRVIVRNPPPPGPPAPDTGDIGQASSILRLGGAQRERTSVADGRIDRPAPRPDPDGSLPGGDTESGLVVVRQDVRDLIEQVARFYGFETNLSRQVRGDVENTTLPSDFNAFLERLADERNLVFYFRNRELNASARDENVSRVIGLGQSNPAELRAAIEAAGIDADRFPVRFIEASNSVLIDGPPSFVALAEVIAESLVRTERPAAEITVIRGNTIERSRPGERPERQGLAPIEFGPSVLDEPAPGTEPQAPANGRQPAAQ